MSDYPTSLVAMVAFVAIAPFFLVLVTSFTKIAVVLSLLRTAIGVPQVPSDRVVTGLAIVLSLFVMAPVGQAIWVELEPWAAQAAVEAPQWSPDAISDVADDAVEPLRAFLVKHAAPEEVEHMTDLANQLQGPDVATSVAPESLRVIVPAFVLTELKEAFTIGFLLFLPFLVVDLVVANVLLSLGMNSIAPTSVSLPFKLLLFVLADGWYLVVRGLLLGYA